ncbi:hypothetical protein TRVL_05005 [Trypanosoma vivax]|nr:hypothetical protein TRVL_05005 [Trypanosoma vivax]
MAHQLPQRRALSHPCAWSLSVAISPPVLLRRPDLHSRPLESVDRVHVPLRCLPQPCRVISLYRVIFAPPLPRSLAVHALFSATAVHQLAVLLGSWSCVRRKGAARLPLSARAACAGDGTATLRASSDGKRRQSSVPLPRCGGDAGTFGSVPRGPAGAGRQSGGACPELGATWH